jgi:CRP-like cAMP-binding protein
MQLASITKRRSLVQGDVLFRAGDPSSKLYAVFQGHFKTAQASLDGEQQVIVSANPKVP